MKHFFVIMLCLIGVCHAGFQKQQTSNVSSDISETTKKTYNAQGDVDLQPLGDIQVEEKIAFKLNDRVVVGTVKQRVIDEQNTLKIFGVFDGSEKSGFIFEFKSTKKDEINVKGVLYFVETNKIYSLQLNESKKTLYFKEDKIVARDSKETKPVE